MLRRSTGIGVNTEQSAQAQPQSQTDVRRQLEKPASGNFFGVTTKGAPKPKDLAPLKLPPQVKPLKLPPLVKPQAVEKMPLVKPQAVERVPLVKPQAVEKVREECIILNTAIYRAEVDHSCEPHSVYCSLQHNLMARMKEMPAIYQFLQKHPYSLGPKLHDYALQVNPQECHMRQISIICSLILCNAEQLQKASDTDWKQRNRVQEALMNLIKQTLKP